MRQAWLLVLALPCSWSVVSCGAASSTTRQAAEVAPMARARANALIWSRSLVGGRLDPALAVSATPFWFDRGLVVDAADLRARLAGVIAQRGARDLPIEVRETLVGCAELVSRHPELARGRLRTACDAVTRTSADGPDGVRVIVLGVQDEILWILTDLRDGRVVGFVD